MHIYILIQISQLTIFLKLINKSLEVNHFR